MVYKEGGAVFMMGRWKKFLERVSYLKLLDWAEAPREGGGLGTKRVHSDLLTEPEVFFHSQKMMEEAEIPRMHTTKFLALDDSRKKTTGEEIINP